MEVNLVRLVWHSGVICFIWSCQPKSSALVPSSPILYDSLHNACVVRVVQYPQIAWRVGPISFVFPCHHPCDLKTSLGSLLEQTGVCVAHFLGHSRRIWIVRTLFRALSLSLRWKTLRYHHGKSQPSLRSRSLPAHPLRLPAARKKLYQTFGPPGPAMDQVYGRDLTLIHRVVHLRFLQCLLALNERTPGTPHHLASYRCLRLHHHPQLPGCISSNTPYQRTNARLPRRPRLALGDKSSLYQVRCRHAQAGVRMPVETGHDHRATTGMDCGKPTNRTESHWDAVSGVPSKTCSSETKGRGLKSSGSKIDIGRTSEERICDPQCILDGEHHTRPSFRLPEIVCSAVIEAGMADRLAWKGASAIVRVSFRAKYKAPSFLLAGLLGRFDSFSKQTIRCMIPNVRVIQLMK